MEYAPTGIVQRERERVLFIELIELEFRLSEFLMDF